MSFSKKRSVFLPALVLALIATPAIADVQTELKKTATDFYGADFNEPAPESLIGRYLSETGAQTVVRSFLTAPEGSQMPLSKLGPKKLVVAVSARSFPAFAKYFFGSQLLHFVHSDVPRHDYVGSYEGIRGTPWGGQHFEEFKFTRAGDFVVPILLTPDEGVRAHAYFELAKVDGNLAFFPGALKNDKSEPYAASNMNNCSAWLANMPIGAELVDHYDFWSGTNDGSSPSSSYLKAYSQALNTAPMTYIDKEVWQERRVEVKRWWKKKPDIKIVKEKVIVKVPDPNRKQYAPLTEKLKKLANDVWTIPGHQLLGDLIGQHDARLRGEFDNMGWAGYTMLGSVNTVRSPVVFIFVDDHQKVIDPAFKLMITPF